MRKTLLLSLFIIGVLTLFLFRQTLLEELIEWQLKKALRPYPNAMLVYEKLELQMGKIKIIAPHFTADGHDPKNSIEFKAKELELNYSIAPLHWRLHGTIHLEKPEATLIKESNTPFSSKELTRFLPKKFNSNFILSCNKGTILLKEKEGEKITYEEQILFHLNEIKIHPTTFSLDLLLGKEENSLEKVNLLITPSTNPFTIDLLTEKLSCRRALKVGAFFTPFMGNRWEIEEDGKINGKINVTFSKEAPFPKITGTASISTCKLFHKQLNIISHIPLLTANFDQAKGKIHFKKGLSFSLSTEENKNDWAIKDLEGSIDIDQEGKAKSVFQGLFRNYREFSPLIIEGEAFYDLINGLSVDLSLDLLSDIKENSSLFLTTRKTDTHHSYTEVEFSHIDSHEFSLFQNLLKTQYPFMNNFTMSKGSLGGVLELDLGHQGPEKITLSSLSCRDLELLLTPSNSLFSASKLTGQGSLNLLANNPLTTLEGSFELSNGEGDLNLFKRKNSWHLSDMEGTLHFKRGMLDRSFVKAAIGMVDCSLFFDWFTPEKMLSISLSGEAKELSTLFSGKQKENFSHAFSKENFSLEAFVSRQQGLFELKGSLLFSENQPIDFGLEIGKAPQSLWKLWPVASPENEQWLANMFQASELLSPGLSLPSTISSNNTLTTFKGFGGTLFQKGYFKGKNLPLEKFVSPFIFPSSDISLKGNSDIEGSFSHQNISIKYSIDSLAFENSHLLIAMDRSTNSSPTKQRWAEHFFDLKSLNHYGIIPVCQAKYIHKNPNLLFTEVSGDLFLSNQHVFVERASGLSHDLTFRGDLHVDYSNRKAITIDINADQISGEISAVQQFCKNFENSELTTFPLNGKITTIPGRSSFHFLLLQDKLAFNCEIEGKMEEGSYTILPEKSFLKKLSSDFVYNSSSQKILLLKSEGILDDSSGSYNIKSPQIEISLLPPYKIDFDLSLFDKKEELIRLVGNSFKEKNQSYNQTNNDKITNFSFNNSLCHIGSILPNIKELRVKNLSEILTFSAAPTFHLSRIFEDADHLFKLGLLPLQNNLLQQYKENKLFGEIEGEVYLDDEEPLYHFFASGNNLIVNDNEVDNFVFNGTTKENYWNINLLQIGDFALHSEIEKKALSWKIPLLRLRYGKSLVVGLEGEYFESDQRLKASLNLFDANIRHLSEYSFLSNFSSRWNPKGQIHATGSLEAQFLPQQKKWNYEANVKSTFDKLSLGEISFNIAKPIHCRYSSEKGILAEKLNLTIAKEGSIPTSVMVQQVDYSPTDKNWKIDGLDFSLTTAQIASLEKLAQELPTVKIEEYKELIDIVRKAKNNAPIVGNLNIETSPKDFSLSLALEDGEYFFKGLSHKIKNFNFKHNSGKRSLKSEFFFNDQWLLSEIATDSKELDNGKISLWENSSSKEKNPLTFYWIKDSKSHFHITKAEGNLFNSSFNLYNSHSPPRGYSFTGKASIDFRSLSQLLPTTIREKISGAKIGKGYTLSGKLSLEAFNPFNWEFKGKVEGDNCEFFHHTLEKLSADIHFHKEFLSLHDLKVDDPIALLKCEKILIAENEKQEWTFSTPFISAEKIRPQLLHNQPSTRSRNPLVITYAEVEGFHGNLSDFKSFTGRGYFKFQNPSKKNIFNILLAIPNDIISRIGLDLNLLTPVMGTIFYEIQDKKLFFKKFNNVYSEGRRSKFYLSKNSGHSYMDLSGNLHLKVKMKQYNLIFKIAELFTISIGGTLDKPTYTLRKHIVETPEVEPSKSNAA